MPKSRRSLPSRGKWLRSRRVPISRANTVAQTPRARLRWLPDQRSRMYSSARWPSARRFRGSVAWPGRDGRRRSADARSGPDPPSPDSGLQPASKLPGMPTADCTSSSSSPRWTAAVSVEHDTDLVDVRQRDQRAAVDRGRNRRAAQRCSRTAERGCGWVESAAGAATARNHPVPRRIAPGNDGRNRVMPASSTGIVSSS